MPVNAREKGLPMNQDRLAKVRANLRNQGLEQALLVDPLSIWWLCGYYTEPYERFLALYVPAEGTPTLFLMSLSCTVWVSSRSEPLWRVFTGRGPGQDRRPAAFSPGRPA